MKKFITLFLALVLCMTMLAACGSNSEPTTEPTTVPTTEPTTEPTEAAWDANVALQKLLDENPASENYLVLSGIGGGWAPVVMVLDNDGCFFCLVDYAGQATVNFLAGTYEEAADGSIICYGSEYDANNEHPEYPLAFADGTYSITLDIPNTGDSAELTGAK